MNILERKMLDALTELKEKYNVYGIKAEFEAEGTRTEDLIKLQYVVNKAGLKICVKIGGCEAVRDIDECKLFNIEAVMAPMIESAFAMKKFIGACEKVYDKKSEYDKVDKIINLETINAYNCMEEIFEVGKNFLDSVVVGRVDLTASLGLTRQDVNSQTVLDYTRKICAKAKEYGFISSFGGGVSAEVVPFVKEMEDVIDRFETRKIIFPVKDIGNKPDLAIKKAVEFEYYYLKNKFDYYYGMASEDAQRLEMLEKRMQ
jgi:4-hydroxy-2-oxoheptanedioate aldolase